MFPPPYPNASTPAEFDAILAKIPTAPTKELPNILAAVQHMYATIFQKNVNLTQTTQHLNQANAQQRTQIAELSYKISLLTGINNCLMVQAGWHDRRPGNTKPNGEAAK